MQLDHTVAFLYAEWVRDNSLKELEEAGKTVEEEVADCVFNMINASDGVDLCYFGEDPRARQILETIGGFEYCGAVKQWFTDRREVHEFNCRRKPENRKPSPTAPPLPLY